MIFTNILPYQMWTVKDPLANWQDFLKYKGFIWHNVLFCKLKRERNNESEVRFFNLICTLQSEKNESKVKFIVRNQKGLKNMPEEAKGMILISVIVTDRGQLNSTRSLFLLQWIIIRSVGHYLNYDSYCREGPC